MQAYDKIFNPYTNSFVNTNSNVGRYLINNMVGGRNIASASPPVTVDQMVNEARLQKVTDDKIKILNDKIAKYFTSLVATFYEEESPTMDTLETYLIDNPF